MSDKPTFVFIHGAWHDKHTWDLTVAELAERGYASVTLDLPGAGTNAAAPASFANRPLDPAAFGTEPSPNAGVTQQERTDHAIEAVRQAKQHGNGKVVLVGHSLGGLTITPVAEAIPSEVDAVVYLTAFMMPNGMVAGEIIGHETMAEAMVPSLFMADPEVVGAMRMDVASTDAEYVAQARQAFYADLTDDQFSTAMSHLHPDEPAQVAGVPSNITADNFGTVDRHYIRCTEDRAISIEGQDLMIDLTDKSIGSATTQHTLGTSHSPFFSDVNGLCDILVGIAG